MDQWKPLEIVAMAAVLTVAVVSLGILAAWYRLRSRRLELSACTTDDQAARILGESLSKVNMGSKDVEEVMTAFGRMDSASKRSLASAIAGAVSAAEMYSQVGQDTRILGMVRGLSGNGRTSPGSGAGE